MPDRYALTLHTALASNTGGPYTATWDRVIVPETGTIIAVTAVAQSLSSNARTNSVDVFYQTDAPSAGSNSATSVLTSAISLTGTLARGTGTVRQSGARVTAGDTLELRTDAGTLGSTPAFKALAASVVIERD